MFVARPDTVRKHCSPLAAAAFLRASGQCSSLRHQIRIPPEPAPRRGLSLARNGAFAPLGGRRSRPAPSLPRGRIAWVRSMSNSSRATSVLKPMQGDLIAGHPFSTPTSRALSVSTASTPLQAVAAFRIKAFSRSHCQKLALRNIRSSFRTRFRPAQQIVP